MINQNFQLMTSLLRLMTILPFLSCSASVHKNMLMRYMSPDPTHTMTVPSWQFQQSSANWRERPGPTEAGGARIWEVTHGFWLQSRAVIDSQSLKDARYSKLEWHNLKIKAKSIGRNIRAGSYLGNKMTLQNHIPKYCRRWKLDKN